MVLKGNFVDRSKIIRTLFITIVAEVISFGILIPIVPVLFTEPSSPYFMLPEMFSIQQGYILLGLLIGLYPLGQFLATPILGEMSDIYGRRKIIELSVFGTVISSIIFGVGIMVGNVWILFVSRVVNGLTGGLISIGYATIADITDDEERSSNFGLIGAAFGTGFILGPFLGGLLSSDMLPFLSASLPFFFAAALSASSLVFVHRELEETSPMEEKTVNWLKPLDQLKKGLNLPGLRKLFGANFFYFSGFAFFTTFIPVYLVQNFNFSQFQIGIFYLYIGILVIIGQVGLVRVVFNRLEEARIMPFVLFFTGLFIFLQPLAWSLAIFLVVVTLFSLNNGLTQVALNTLISKGSSKADQGLALGTNQGLRAIGNAIPSMLSGVAAAVFAPSAPLLIAGMVIMSTAIVYQYIS